MSFYNSSATAASNTTINSISAAGSASANLIDDLIRQLAAQDRQFANDLGGNNTVGGTADAIAITPSSGSVTAAFDGLLIGFIAAYDNATTTPTANVGGLGAEPIKKAVNGVEKAPLVGDIQAGGHYFLRWRSAWDSSNGAWELVDAGNQSVYASQGIAKAWGFYNQATPAVQDSLNISSVTDVGTGQMDWNYTNAMAGSNNQSITLAVSEAGSSSSAITHCVDSTRTFSASVVSTETAALSGSTRTNIDDTRSMFHAMGELA